MTASLICPHLERSICEDSLRDFTETAWGQIDTARFEPNWHIDAISEHLEAIADRQIKRLMISVPPRTMKSLSASVSFPSWVWAQDTGKGSPAVKPGTWRGPGVKFVALSYAMPLSLTLAVKHRRLITSPWYQQHWGERVKLSADQAAKQKFENTRGGYRYSSSPDGGVIGEGGDIIIVDDPHNTLAPESDKQRRDIALWWDEAVATRLNNQATGAFIVVMQRLHAQDLTGHILSKEFGWDHLCLPMRYEKDHPTPVRSSLGFKDPRTEEGELFWPARFPEPDLTALETKLGSYATAGQHQQRPAPREGGMFKRAWFADRFVNTAPADTRWVRHWDLAATKGGSGARTAGVKIGRDREGRFYVGHVIREREEGGTVRKIIKATAETDGKRVVISLPQDPGQAGKVQSQDMVRMLAGYRAYAEPESGDKVTRAEPFAAQCEAGNVYLVRGEWNEAYLEELCTFPNGLKDQVDASSGAFARLIKTRAGLNISDDLVART